MLQHGNDERRAAHAQPQHNQQLRPLLVDEFAEHLFGFPFSLAGARCPAAAPTTVLRRSTILHSGGRAKMGMPAYSSHSLSTLRRKQFPSARMDLAALPARVWQCRERRFDSTKRVTRKPRVPGM